MVKVVVNSNVNLRILGSISIFLGLVLLLLTRS